jgi:hypothetical protein
MSDRLTAEQLEQMPIGSVVYVGPTVRLATPYKRVTGGWKRFYEPGDVVMTVGNASMRLSASQSDRRLESANAEFDRVFRAGKILPIWTYRPSTETVIPKYVAPVWWSR